MVGRSWHRTCNIHWLARASRSPGAWARNGMSCSGAAGWSSKVHLPAHGKATEVAAGETAHRGLVFDVAGYVVEHDARMRVKPAVQAQREVGLPPAGNVFVRQIKVRNARRDLPGSATAATPRIGW